MDCHAGPAPGAGAGQGSPSSEHLCAELKRRGQFGSMDEVRAATCAADIHAAACMPNTTPRDAGTASKKYGARRYSCETGAEDSHRARARDATAATLDTGAAMQAISDSTRGDEDADVNRVEGALVVQPVKRRRTERSWRLHASDVLHALVPGHVLSGVPMEQDEGELLHHQPVLYGRVLRSRPDGSRRHATRRVLPRRQAAPAGSLADWASDEGEDEDDDGQPVLQGHPMVVLNGKPVPEGETDDVDDTGGADTPAAAAAEPAAGDGRRRAGSRRTCGSRSQVSGLLPSREILTVRSLLRAGAFSGRVVEYRSRGGKVLLNGTVTEDGYISVQDPGGGGGTVTVTASGFEALSGSSERRPGAGICLPSGRSLKDICDALNGALGHTPPVLTGVPIQTHAAVPVEPAPVPAPQEHVEHASTLDETTGLLSPQEEAAAVGPLRRAAAVAATAAVRRHTALLNNAHGGASARVGQGDRGAGALAQTAATRDVCKHRRLFSAEGGPHALSQGQQLRYQTSSGRVLATGQVRGTGIACHCGCNAVFSCSGWEVHLGRGTRRAPYDCIYTTQGINLRQLASSASEGGHLSGRRASLSAPVARAARRTPRNGPKAASAAAATAVATQEFHSMVTRALAVSADNCGQCGDGGQLLLCDSCPAAFHAGCVGLRAAPTGDAQWHCAACMSAGMPLPAPPGVAPVRAGSLAAIAARCQRLLADLDALQGGCCLCKRPDFQAEGFGPRTVLLCDQCEREYHVECLSAAGLATMTSLPPGSWFCQPQCSAIASGLAARVAAGERAVPASIAGRNGAYTLHVLCGGGSRDADSALDMVTRVLCESFDPIVDTATGVDLLPLMVQASATENQEHSFTRMHAALLRCNGQPVCAAVFRVFDAALAELPLVATEENARRQGHCAVLVRCMEALLTSLGVARLALPAAHEVEAVWTKAFHFQPMADELLRRARAELKLLVFPGSRMLVKNLR